MKDATNVGATNPVTRLESQPQQRLAEGNGVNLRLRCHMSADLKGSTSREKETMRREDLVTTEIDPEVGMEEEAAKLIPRVRRLNTWTDLLATEMTMSPSHTRGTTRARGKTHVRGTTYARGTIYARGMTYARETTAVMSTKFSGRTTTPRSGVNHFPTTRLQCSRRTSTAFLSATQVCLLSWCYGISLLARPLPMSRYVPTRDYSLNLLTRNFRWCAETLAWYLSAGLK